MRQVTEKGLWEDWILYVLEMIEHTSVKGLSRLESIVKTMDEYSSKIKEILPTVYSKDLIELLFNLPYTKRKKLIDAGLGSPKTVGNYLISLEEKGFLKSIKMGKEKLYLNFRLMEILE